MIDQLAYKPGWVFKRGGPGGTMLCVFVTSPDTLHPECTRCTQHQFTIPHDLHPKPFARWVFDRIMDIERHEAAEAFQHNGTRPFWPNHQDEGSPYAHVERW